MDPNISLITLGAEELNVAIRFYRDGLGFPLQDREDDVSQNERNPQMRHVS